MMGHREAMINGDERDYLGGSRGFYVKRAGKFARVKKAFNRRIRKQARIEAQQEAMA